MKRCYKCGETDPGKFYKDQHAADGLTSSCKACQKARAKDSYEKKKDTLDDAAKTRRKAAYDRWKARNPGKYQAHYQRHNKARPHHTILSLPSALPTS